MWFGNVGHNAGERHYGYLDAVAVSNTALGPNNFALIIPEPSSVVLAVLGAVGLAVVARRRRRRA